MAKKKGNLTNAQLRDHMESGIVRMREIIDDKESGKQEKVQAANAMSGLINRYKDLFSVAPEEPGELKSVKNF